MFDRKARIIEIIRKILEEIAPIPLKRFKDGWDGMPLTALLLEEDVRAQFVSMFSAILQNEMPNLFLPGSHAILFAHLEGEELRKFLFHTSPRDFAQWILDLWSVPEPDDDGQDSSGLGLTEKREDVSATLVRIFYATDRKPSVDPKVGFTFASQRSKGGQLNYGECVVSIPAQHQTGHLESPSILKLEFRSNPREHIVLQETLTVSEQEFFDRIRQTVSASPKKDAFIFVHGYNVTFEDAARRTGQFAFDLHFLGAPIFYSWPSNGRVLDYLADQDSVIWTAPHFERFLTLLSDRGGVDRVYLIAHSMGNRAVCDALRSLHQKKFKSGGFLLHHLVLAAPDIDADTFRELADSLKSLSGHVTLYVSSKDKALHISQKLHKNHRAGAPPLIIVRGIDSIDASNVDTDFLAHSYFNSNWPLLSDIYSTILDDKAPSTRFGLRRLSCSEGVYYTFRP